MKEKEKEKKIKDKEEEDKKARQKVKDDIKAKLLAANKTVCAPSSRNKDADAVRKEQFSLAPSELVVKLSTSKLLQLKEQVKDIGEHGMALKANTSLGFVVADNKMEKLVEESVTKDNNAVQTDKTLSSKDQVTEDQIIESVTEDQSIKSVTFALSALKTSSSDSSDVVDDVGAKALVVSCVAVCMAIGVSE